MRDVSQCRRGVDRYQDQRIGLSTRPFVCWPAMYADDRVLTLDDALSVGAGGRCTRAASDPAGRLV